MNKDQKKQLASANAEAIRIAIGKLGESVGAEGASFTDFWLGVRDVTDMFKTFKPLAKKDREELWSTFSDLRNRVRKVQEGAMGELKRASAELKARIEEIVERAETLLEDEENREAVEEADSLLKEALALMKAPKGGKKSEGEVDSEAQDSDHPVLLKKDRERCWPKWLKAREKVQELRKKLSRKLLEELSSEAESLLADSEDKPPREVKKRVKDTQVALKEARLRASEREKIRKILRKAWERASERLTEEIGERRQKHREWLDRMKEHLRRWETTLLKNRYVLERVETSPSGSERRIEELKKEIAELEEKIASVRSRLGREAPEPVTELPPEEKARLDRPARRPAAGKRRSPKPERIKVPEPPPMGLSLGEILAEKLKGTGLLNGENDDD